jgi:UDP:flavonoid glycosyltransferase YjiC (YdhE family)
MQFWGWMRLGAPLAPTPESQSVKVAIVTEGTRGDVYPMLALGASLISAGHGVRLCAPPDFESAARSSGVEFLALGENIRAFLTESADALHSRGLKLITEMKRWGARSIANQFRVLPGATSDVDYVIASGTILGAPSAAELHGIPYRYVTYTPALLPSREHSPAMFPFQVRAPWANRLLWRGCDLLMNGIARRDVNAYRREMGLPPVRDIHRHVLAERPIVAVDRHLAPVPEDCPVAHDQIRCLHPDAGEPLPDKLESFLEQGPPPVYLGFGSMTDPDPAGTTRRLLEAIAQLGCRALLSRGWAGLGDGALPEGVMAIDPVAHARLFPRLAAVVHHGGAGTTHSAARAGVPQIVVPHVLDQFYFARRVHTLGVGPPPIPRRQLGVERLVETLRATLDNELLSERARELAQRLAGLGPVRPDPALVLR